MYETWLPTDVMDRLAKGEQLTVVDVREIDEWESGHIVGAKHIPLSEIPARKGELNINQTNVIVCRSGGRSGQACKYLSAEGYQVINMLGGMLQWNGNVAH